MDGCVACGHGTIGAVPPAAPPVVNRPVDGAHRRAGRIGLTWYLISVAAAGLPLMLWQWRRAKRARRVRL